MKRKTIHTGIIRTFLGFCLTIFVFSLHVAAAEVPVLKDIRLGVHPHKTRLVLELSEATPYRVFSLSNPNRVIIDLPETQWTAAEEKIKPVGLVTAYRVGKFEDGHTRFVLEVSQPTSAKNSFLLPPTETYGPRLVVDLQPITLTEFIEQAGLATGDFDPDAPAVGYQPIPEALAAVPVPQKSPRLHQNIKPIIVVDAGHGGVDPGTIGKGGVYEKRITLAVAKRLKTALEKTGHYKVYLTRDTDTYIKLRERVNIARRLNADLFISLHVDAIAKPSISGASVYTLSENASDKEAAKLAERENRSDIIAGVDLSSEGDVVASILIDLAQRDTMNKSKQFASDVISNLGSQIKILDNPSRSAGFAVLKAPDIPSILVEMGFLSSRQDEKKLQTAAHQTKIVTALMTAVDTFFAKNIAFARP